MRFILLQFLSISVILLFAGFDAEGATLYSIADGDWSTSGTWSTISHSGASCGCTPASTDDVKIGNGDDITIAAATSVTCASLDINADEIAEGAASTLTLNGLGTSSLTVNGNVRLLAHGSPTNDMFHKITINGGTVTINGNLTMEAEGNGGSNEKSNIYLNTNGDLTVTGNITQTSDGEVCDINTAYTGCVFAIGGTTTQTNAYRHYRRRFRGYH